MIPRAVRIQFLNRPPQLEPVPGAAQPKPNVRKTLNSTYGGVGGEEPRGPYSDLRLEDHVAVHESAVDAVDGSSTGTRVPKMGAPIRLPRFGGANDAYGHDNRSRHCHMPAKAPLRCQSNTADRSSWAHDDGVVGMDL